MISLNTAWQEGVHLPVLHVDEIRQLEKEALAETPPQPLMERAAAAATQWLQAYSASTIRSICVLIGPGNNGGDGWVMAQMLKAAGHKVRMIALCDQRQRIPTQAKPEDLLTIADWQGFEPGECVVDALFGIGWRRPARDDSRVEHITDLGSDYKDLHRYAKRVHGAETCFSQPWQTLLQAAAVHCRRERVPLLALDVPSGVEAETGFATDDAVQATHTISFIGLKLGLLTGAGRQCSGEIWFAPLLVQQMAVWTNNGDSKLLPLSIIPKPQAGIWQEQLNKVAHKGQRGDVLVIGGGEGMAGAAVLAARAALHAGAGRVLATLPWPCDPVFPEIMKLDPEAWLAGHLRTAAATVGLIGPGLLGHGDRQHKQDEPDDHEKHVGDQIKQALDKPIPWVLDADALYLMAKDWGIKDKLNERVTIMTPHPLEAAKLLRWRVNEVEANRLKAAVTLARHTDAIVVLKGAGTLVTDGNKIAINTSGHAGLATGGSGDVLAGLIAALWARSLAFHPWIMHPSDENGDHPDNTVTRAKERAFHIACQAVAWHGMAAGAKPSLVLPSQMIDRIPSLLNDDQALSWL